MDAVNSLQQVVPWLAGLPILQKVIATIGIAALVTLLLVIIWTPPAEQAVSTILSKCYTRALFTRMHAQISQEAMFASIDKCRETVQAQIPLIRSKDLQQEAMRLLVAVDGIGMKKAQPDPDAINKLKVAALKSFRKLADATKGSYVLPENDELGEAVYFTQAEADAPLNIADLKNQLPINPKAGATIPDPPKK